MEYPRLEQRRMGRLLRMAEQEKTSLFKAMPKEFKARIEGVTLCFEDKPSMAMIERGVQAESLTSTDRESKQITFFLMNLRDQFGRFPTDVRQNLRRTILQELGDWAGIEIDWDDGP
jgi:hypothetical protein